MNLRCRSILLGTRKGQKEMECALYCVQYDVVVYYFKECISRFQANCLRHLIC